jgi:hypothetical protein
MPNVATGISLSRAPARLAQGWRIDSNRTGRGCWGANRRITYHTHYIKQKVEKLDELTFVPGTGITYAEGRC